ncbi:MAG: lipoprotein LpqH [Mycobacteriaceae bacterium]|nr:lipoprotein LpqH [Mycobacteriaceae bacterium]
MNRQPRLRVILAAVQLTVLTLAMLACSGKNAGPTSVSSPGPAPAPTTVQTPGQTTAADADLVVDGHRHTFSGTVVCATQAANPSGTPPRGDLEISAHDETASFSISWLLQDASAPLAALSLAFKVDNGEYTMPYYPHPPQVEATNQDKTYTVKGTPPVQTPGQNTMTNVPVEIHATCP